MKEHAQECGVEGVQGMLGANWRGFNKQQMQPAEETKGTGKFDEGYEPTKQTETKKEEHAKLQGVRKTQEIFENQSFLSQKSESRINKHMV